MSPAPDHNTPLTDGYKRFIQKGGAFARTLMAQAHSQAPHSAIITCCDSRIDPVRLFDAEPGQLFIIRNAGAWVSPASASQQSLSETLAALQLALSELPIQRVLVMGHSNCGAAMALAGRGPVEPPLSAWLEPKQSILTQWADGGDSPDRLPLLEQALIAQSVAALKTWEFVSTAIQSRNLHIGGAWFSIEDLALHRLQPDGRFAKEGFQGLDS